MDKNKALVDMYNEHVTKNTKKKIAELKKPAGESTKRSLLKTLSWEFVHLVIIAGVIFVFTGKWEYATIGALIYIAWEALAYFIHERVWAKFVKIK